MSDTITVALSREDWKFVADYLHATVDDRGWNLGMVSARAERAIAAIDAALAPPATGAGEDDDDSDIVFFGKPIRSYPFRPRPSWTDERHAAIRAAVEDVIDRAVTDATFREARMERDKVAQRRAERDAAKARLYDLLGITEGAGGE